MRLNLQESSLKKKRGISFFVDNRKKDFDLLNIESKGTKLIQIDDVDANCKRRNLQQAQWKSAERSIQNEPDTAIDSANSLKYLGKHFESKQYQRNLGGIVRTEPSALDIGL